MANDEDGLHARTGPALAMLAVLTAACILMVIHALVAGISILDHQLLDQTEGWFRWSPGLAGYLGLGRTGLALALFGIFAGTEEEQ